MGNKIITEKDFWMCTTGAVPAPFQGRSKMVKKSTTEKYITIEDKATSSAIDFGCTRLMLIMAIIVAAVVVIAALAVVTGGAALIAIGALAGLAGAAYGAVLGSLLCGQLAAKARKWIMGKENFEVQGAKAITGNHQMTCPVGGVITFAPQIKSWSQAISLAAATYIGKLMEGMMAGAAIGMCGAAVSGGVGAFASGGIRGMGQAAWQFGKSVPMNIIKNIGASFGYSGGFSLSSVGFAGGLRALTAAHSGLQHYGATGESGWGAAGKGVFGMEEGMVESAHKIAAGEAGWQDIAGLALLLSPVHKATEETPQKKSQSEPLGKEEPQAKPDEEPAKKQEEENTKEANIAEKKGPKVEGEHEAFEDPAPPSPRTNPALVEAVAKKAAELVENVENGIEGFSNTKNGPCLSGVYDPVTGKTFFGQNFGKNGAGRAEYAKFVEDAHPLVKERIKAQQKLIDEGKLPPETDKRAGAHSEVRALDEAIKAREKETGQPFTEKDLGNLDLHNRSLPNNTPKIRCPNCSYITDGVNTVGGHK